MNALDRCYNISHLRALAKRKLPAPMFHYIDGGSDDEWTMRRNNEAFSDYELMPNYLTDIETIDLNTEVLGQQLALPFFLAPTGMSRLFHHEKEFAAAQAAEKFGTLYSLSTMATTNLEDIAKATSTPKMFQVYIFKDRALTKEFVQRCKDSKYEVLCLTVDTPIAGNRERDLITGMTMPPRFSLNSLLSFALHPQWGLNFLRHPRCELENVTHRVDQIGTGTMPLISYVNNQFDRTISWDDAAWLAEQWDGPFVIKGLQSPLDAKRALDIGASALMISNHGGRQLDGAPAPVDCIAPIREAIGDKLELIVDGGVRRGTDIIKAIAQGADACSIGRPYLYGLAAGGQKGVEHSLQLLKSEVERSMALLGCNAISKLNSDHINTRS